MKISHSLVFARMLFSYCRSKPQRSCRGLTRKKREKQRCSPAKQNEPFALKLDKSYPASTQFSHLVMDRRLHFWVVWKQSDWTNADFSLHHEFRVEPCPKTLTGMNHTSPISGALFSSHKFDSPFMNKSLLLFS